MAKTSVPTEDRGSLICLGGGVESLGIVRHIKELGYRPIVLDNNPDCAVAQWAKTFKQPRVQQSKRHEVVFIKADCYNAASCRMAFAEAINKPRRFNIDGGFYRGDDVRGMMCCGIDAPMIAAELAHYLHRPSLGEASRFGANKYWQVKRLDEAGIPVPPTKVLNPEMSLGEVQNYDIVKPVDSRGARGVRWYTSKDYQEAIIEAASFSKLRSVIGQKWLEGKQYSTESVMYDKQMLFTAVAQRNYDRLDEFYPYIIEDGSDCPAELDADERHAINDTIERACLALEWDNLTVKGDLVIDPLTGVVSIIELAPRLSGGYFASDIIPLAYGWDVIQDAVLIAIGQKPILKLTRYYDNLREVSNYVCQRFVFPKSEWIGRRLKKLPEIISANGKNTWNYSEGDIVRPVKSHPDRLGMILVTASVPQEAIRLANEVVDKLTEMIDVE